MADELANRKFGLDALTTMVNLKIALAKAEADYAYRMMEVAEKQEKIMMDKVKRIQLQNAIRDYKRARNDAEQKVKDLEREAEKISDAVFHANLLALGESMPYTAIGRAWTGLQYLLWHSKVTVINQLSAKVTPEWLVGGNFIRLSKPDFNVPDPPQTNEWTFPIKLVSATGCSTNIWNSGV
jgi:hypothetical protein